ncbi:MAG: znuC [Nocardioidaceae bacterium]|nr:znuC [Nocardioidaceae bacterium]
MTGTPALELSDVGVSFGGRPVLRGVDLGLRQGEVVALLGPNGSGKSTLVRAAVGLNPLATGDVRLFGTPLSSFTAWPRLGYVPQRATAATGVPASVGEVVASGRLSRRRLFLPLSRTDKDAVATALETVGLADRATHLVSTLSGGQQQRVLTARALAGEPDLVVLDEPTAGVDHESQHRIADALGDRARSGGTVLVVLHELGPFAPLIDRVVVLHEGRITHDGPAEAVDLADEHAHHHPGDRPRDFMPEVRAPLEGRH